MRLLISSTFGADAVPLGAALAAAARRLGHDVACCDSQPRSLTHQLFAKHVAAGLRRVLGRDVEASVPGSAAWRRPRDLARTWAQHRPDCVLIVMGNRYPPGVLPRLAERLGGQRIGWWVKDTRCSDTERALASEFDALASIGPWPADAGIALVAAFAADRERWHPPAAPVAQDLDLVFVGGGNARRDPFFRALAAALPDQLHLYGPHWSQRGFAAWHRSDALWGNALRSVLHRAKLVINVASFSAAPGAPGAGDLSGGGAANLRLLDVPLCGSLLLSEAGPEANALYGALAERTTFRTPEELVAAATHLLHDDTTRQALAAAQHAIAAAQPTYEDVVKRLVGLSW